MNEIVSHPFFIAFWLALLCYFAGRRILHLFGVGIDGLNIFLRISIPMAVAELSAIFLLNIFLIHVSCRSAGLLVLVLFLILAATQLASAVRKPPPMKSWSAEMLPAAMLALMVLPAFYGLLHSTIEHIELKYLFVSYIRNSGLPLVEKLPDGSWLAHNYHYGPELIVAALSPLAPSYDCAGFINLTRIPGALHIVMYVLMLYGVTSQLLPAMAWKWKCVITFFVLYYGGNTLFTYLAYSHLPLAAFIDESLVPQALFDETGGYNLLVRSPLSDSIIVLFRGWESSLQHLLLIFLPVLWVLVVNRLCGGNGLLDRKETVFSSALLVIMLLSAFLIHEEVPVYVMGAGMVYLFYKIDGGAERCKNRLIWATLVVLATGLFALLQGGTISHFFYSSLAGGKTSLLSSGQGAPQGDFKGIILRDVRIGFTPKPSLLDYKDKMSVIKHPWRVIVRHGIDYYILIPVVVFYLLRRIKPEASSGFAGILDCWVMMAVPMAFFSLFLRGYPNDTILDRFNKIELAALAILLAFFWIWGKARAFWAATSVAKYRAFCLAAALFFVFSTTKSIFYYVAFPRVGNTPLQEYCAERVNKFVNDSR